MKQKTHGPQSDVPQSAGRKWYGWYVLLIVVLIVLILFFNWFTNYFS